MEVSLGINVSMQLFLLKEKNNRSITRIFWMFFLQYDTFACQGIISGATQIQSNLFQLCHLRLNDNPDLKSWLLQMRQKFLPRDIQNKYLTDMANTMFDKLLLISWNMGVFHWKLMNLVINYHSRFAMLTMNSMFTKTLLASTKLGKEMPNIFTKL